MLSTWGKCRICYTVLVLVHHATTSWQQHSRHVCPPESRAGLVIQRLVLFSSWHHPFVTTHIITSASEGTVEQGPVWLTRPPTRGSLLSRLAMWLC
jgi:hypothetical protein